ncbi:Short-chain dehydrogenase/reductase SDR [Bosea sp. LC85]|uniref:SDR family NAD(P)-dependent oxidoreductase n=1 Tax=Bosea sp. LC85 TaxID=1502851 RepID=UPI0004E30671|nr:SDR family oxidoreductase [Bosea sp. LC85]KFC63600.1 Short-chain dehydrogenase/reductase SDR [Bosea sp. LC85]
MQDCQKAHRGKIAVVTGASGGIGAAICAKLNAEGARVIALDRQDGPGSTGIDRRIVDIANTAALQDTVAQIAADYGRIDIWVNNAGFLERRAALDITRDGWGKSIDVNLTAAFFGAQAAARVMKDSGGGSIVNLSSYAGLKARPNCAHYAAAKAAIAHLTSCLAIEWGPLNIRVNAIAPGYIETPMSAWMHADPEQKAIYLGRTPLGRMGQPTEIADSVSFLASDAAGYITGHVLGVDGGIGRS